MPIAKLNQLTMKVAIESPLMVTPVEREWLVLATAVFKMSGHDSLAYPLIGKIPHAVRRADLRLNTLLSISECTYLSGAGRFDECLQVLDELKKVTPPHQENCFFCVVDLAIVRAEVLHHAGQSKQALADLDTFAMQPWLSRDQHAWIDCMKAYIYIGLGQPTIAHKLIDPHWPMLLHQPSKTTTGYLDRAYWRGVQVALSRESQDYAEGFSQAQSLKKDLDAWFTGDIVLKVWNDLELLRFAAQRHDLAALKNLSDDLRRRIKAIPDIEYAICYVDAVNAAVEGRYTSAILDPARRRLSNHHPAVEQMQRFLQRLKSV